LPPPGLFATEEMKTATWWTSLTLRGTRTTTIIDWCYKRKCKL
jgi:hypothetical protein